MIPELRRALVRPVGLVHEELLSGQDSLLQMPLVGPTTLDQAKNI